MKPRSRIFSGKKKAEDILKVKYENMGAGSLLVLSKKESKNAEDVFSLILGVMNKITNPKKYNEHVTMNISKELV